MAVVPGQLVDSVDAGCALSQPVEPDQRQGRQQKNVDGQTMTCFQEYWSLGDMLGWGQPVGHWLAGREGWQPDAAHGLWAPAKSREGGPWQGRDPCRDHLVEGARCIQQHAPAGDPLHAGEMASQGLEQCLQYRTD